MKSKNGFTLIEMMVMCGLVMLLIGLLVAAGADSRKGALIKETHTRIIVLSAAIENYYSEHRFYPNDNELSSFGVERSDKWGNLLQYRGNGDDINNWDRY